MQNRIDAAVSTADKNQILQLIQDIKAKMPFLVDLSAAEIASLNKMGDRGQPFVRDAITAAENDDSFLPRSFDVAAMRKDVDLLEMLPPVIAAVSQLKELLSDTYLLAGSDAFAAALEVYAAAQRNGTGEALSESLRNMGRRFDRKPKPSKETPAKSAEPPET
ncbi:MAG TPA: hypothetical protein VNB22_17310, partial [Pyrinomonadaceae bacterium]|nr:hypothetical protein [Pyrinomonadaceae bacterium]